MSRKETSFWNEGQGFVSNFCFGKLATAILETTDRYGRKVCVVEIDGKELNLVIIEAGFGWHYKQYSKSTVHAAAEQVAQKEKRGLWADQNPIAPWVFRKRK